MMINLHEFFTRCSQRNANSKYLDIMWPRVKTGLLQPVLTDLLNSWPASMANFVWFTDDKLLF